MLSGIFQCHWNRRGIFYHQTRVLLSQMRQLSSHKLVQAVQCPITVTMCNKALLCGGTAAGTSKLAFLSPVRVRGLATKRSPSLESPFSEIIISCSYLYFLCHCTQAELVNELNLEILSSYSAVFLQGYSINVCSLLAVSAIANKLGLHV